MKSDGTFSICIMAGGASTRMGRNKALIPFRGEPLIQRVIERITPIAAEITLISNNPEELIYLGLPIRPDGILGKGPLGGLLTAMEVSTRPLVIVVACDMPFINPVLLKAQAVRCSVSNYDVVIPNSRKGLEPFHAVYRRKVCMPLIKTSLAAGENRMISWLETTRNYKMSMLEIQEYDPWGNSFMNLNTPQDFRIAETLAASME